MIFIQKVLIATFVFISSVAMDPAIQAPEKSPVKFELRRAESKPAPGLTEAEVAGTKDKVYLHKDVAITNKDIAATRATADASNKPAIEITLTKEGQKKFAELSREHQGRPLAIMADGKVLGAPTVRGKISGDRAVIHGNFTKEEAERIANGIRQK